LLKAVTEKNELDGATKKKGATLFFVNYIFWTEPGKDPSIADGELILALENITQEAIDNILEKKLASVKGQTGNDKLKTNTVLQMKDAGIEFKTI
jgi:hypothetical protein